MQAMKQAMEAAKRAAAADARYKAALKRDPAGDASKLERAIAGYVVAADLLDVAVGSASLPDKVKNLLRPKLAAVQSRLAELQPKVEELGLTVPTAQEVGGLAGLGAVTTLPQSPSAAAGSGVGGVAAAVARGGGAPRSTAKDQLPHVKTKLPTARSPKAAAAAAKAAADAAAKKEAEESAIRFTSSDEESSSDDDGDDSEEDSDEDSEEEDSKAAQSSGGAGQQTFGIQSSVAKSGAALTVAASKWEGTASVAAGAGGQDSAPGDVSGGGASPDDSAARVPRYCKKCSAAFITLKCPGGHANFLYSKKIPNGVAIPQAAQSAGAPSCPTSATARSAKGSQDAQGTGKAPPGREHSPAVTKLTWKQKQEAARRKRDAEAAASQLVKPEDVDGQPTGSDASVKKLKKDNPWMQREAAAAVQKQQQQPMPPQQKHTPQVVSLSKKDNQWAQRDKVETAAGPEDVNGKHGNQTTPAHEQQQPHQQSDAVRPVARLHIDAVVHAAEKVADAPAETSAIPRRGTATSAETDVASSQQGHDLHSATAQSTIDALKRKVESLQFELKQAQDQLVHVRADRDSLQMQVDELRSRPTAAAVEDSASAAKQYMQLSHGAAREAERVQKELARQVEELSFKLKQESERSEQLTRERGELQGSFDAQLEATKLADATAQVARAKVESLEADVRQAETSRLEQMAACRVAQDESHAAQQALAGANRAQQHEMEARKNAERDAAEARSVAEVAVAQAVEHGSNRMSSVESALATEKELRALAERSAVGIRKQSTDFIESFTREWRRRLAEEHARGKAAIVTAVKAERSAAAVSAQRLESCESLLQSEVAARTAAEQQLEVVQEQLGGLVASAAVLESNANEHVERRVAAALAQRKQDDAAALENMAQRCSVAEAQAIELESRLELETEARSEMASSTSATTAALTASVQQLTNAASSLQRVRMEREQLVQQVHELQEKLASFAKQDEQEQMAVAAAALHPIGSGEDVLHSNIDTRLRVNFNPLLMDHDELFQEFVVSRQYLAQFPEECCTAHGSQRTISIQTDILARGNKQASEGHGKDDLVTSEVHGYRSELEVEKRRRLDLEFQVVSQDGELCAVLGRLADAEKRVALLGDTETVAAHLQAQVVELMGLQDEAREREAAVAMDLVEAQEQLKAQTALRAAAEDAVSVSQALISQARKDAQAAVSEIAAVERQRARAAEARAEEEAELRSVAEARLAEALAASTHVQLASERIAAELASTAAAAQQVTEECTSQALAVVSTEQARGQEVRALAHATIQDYAERLSQEKKARAIADTNTAQMKAMNDSLKLQLEAAEHLHARTRNDALAAIEAVRAEADQKAARVLADVQLREERAAGELQEEVRRWAPLWTAVQK